MEKLLTYRKVEGKCAEHLEKYFSRKIRSGYVQCEGFVLPEYFQNFGDQIRSMEVHTDDVWVCFVPKSGTTWAQEAVWCIANNVDLEAAKKRPLTQRFPFLEVTIVLDNRKLLVLNPSMEIPEERLNSVNFVDKFPPPRFVKSHLPLALLPIKLQRNETNAKMVYIVRNPRDTCISYYHHSRHLHGYEGDFETFCELFLEGAGSYLPYWGHVLPFWQMRNHPNILFLDLRGNILKIAQFLGKALDEERIDNLIDHLSFDQMKRNLMVNGALGSLGILEKHVMQNASSEDRFALMRSGRAGQWKDVLSQTMVERFHKWEEENLNDIVDYPLLLES